MPQLSDLVKKQKFVKKEFRPWDLSGTGTIDNRNIPNPSTASEAATITETPAIAVQKPDINDEPITEATASLDINKIDIKTGNISGNKEITTREQPDNIKVPQQKQRGNVEVTIGEQIDNFRDNVRGNVDNLAYLIESIKKLSGIQKNIFLYVINVCSARGALDTGNILVTDLASSANCSIGSAKTSLIRLTKKQLVLRLQGKACRGGFMVLGITKEIQAATIQAQKALFNPLREAQTGNISGNTTGNNNHYSSSNILLNNTTTVLPPDWKSINYDSLKSIGFSETQLQQLWEKQLNVPEVIQVSIKHFAFALEKNPKVQSYPDPLNVLMGVLRKGGLWREPNYVSPTDLALQQIVEEKKKAKEKRDQALKELIELEFPVWRKNLTDLQIKDIVPADILKMNVAAAITASLRTHYVENILLPRLEEDGFTDS